MVKHFRLYCANLFTFSGATGKNVKVTPFKVHTISYTSSNPFKFRKPLNDQVIFLVHPTEDNWGIIFSVVSSILSFLFNLLEPMVIKGMHKHIQLESMINQYSAWFIDFLPTEGTIVKLVYTCTLVLVCLGIRPCSPWYGLRNFTTTYAW